VPSEINRYLLEEWGIVGGFDIGTVYPDLGDCLMFCVTEMNLRDEIDVLVVALKEMTKND